MTYTELYQELINNPETKDFKGCLEIQQDQFNNDILVWKSPILDNDNDMKKMAEEFLYYINYNLFKLGFHLGSSYKDLDFMCIQIIKT